MRITDLKPLMPDVLIGLDFDGPIAPIVDDPGASRPVEGAIDTLQKLLDVGAQVAIVSGRDVRTVVELGGLSGMRGLVVNGLYGAESWRDGDVRTDDEVPGMKTLRNVLPARLQAADKALWLEDKGLSLVVHSRRAADPEAALKRIRTDLETLASELDLEVHPGKCVLEMRAPGYDKARALEALLVEFTPQGALFAGDDLGDIPALRALHSWSRQHSSVGVRVAVGEVDEVKEAANVRVDDAERLFVELARLL